MDKSGQKSKAVPFWSNTKRPSDRRKKRDDQQDSRKSPKPEKDPVFADIAGSCSQLCTVMKLPDDVWYLMFQYLSPGTLCKLCGVCKCFRRLASADCVWLQHEKERVLMRSGDYRNIRSRVSLKEKYRVSCNWEKAHRREHWLLRFRQKLLPWLQMHDDTLLVSKANVIQQFTIQSNGFLRERPSATLLGLSTDATRFVVSNGIVVSGCRGGGVSTWEASSGAQLLHYKDVHNSDTECVDVTGSVIVSGSKDKTVKVLSLFPEDANREKKCFNIGDRVWSLSASPNGHVVAVGTACIYSSPIMILDINSGEVLSPLGEEQKRGSGVLDMKFESPNILLTCGYDTYLRMWDLRTNTCVNQWEDKYDSVVFCLQSDGRNTMLTGTARYGMVRLWDKRQQNNVNAFYTGDQNSPVYSLAASYNHMYLAMDLGLDLVDFSVR